VELKLGSIPVRVHGWFILMALLLGANERHPLKLAIWVAVVVVSVVIHELGHAIVGKLFGLAPRIELHGMGGTTSFTAADGAARPPPLGARRNVAISLAGPFAGFLFAAVIVGARLAGLRPVHPLAVHAIALLQWVNIAWGIFNLLPMLPLDGGNVVRAILVAITKQNGERAARVLSIVVAGAIALLAVQRQAWWSLYLGVLFAFQNVQALRQDAQGRIDRAAADAVERAAEATRGRPRTCSRRSSRPTRPRI
jgi:Zn-dependent protease